MVCLIAGRMNEHDLFQLCLVVAWQPIRAAVKRPLPECTTAPAGVAPADYQRHLGYVPVFPNHCLHSM